MTPSSFIPHFRKTAPLVLGSVSSVFNKMSEMTLGWQTTVGRRHLIEGQAQPFFKKTETFFVSPSQSSLYVEIGYPVGVGVADGSKSY